MTPCIVDSYKKVVAGGLYGVAETGFLVTKQREIRPFQPYLYFGDLCHVFHMTIVITPLYCHCEEGILPDEAISR